MCLCLKHPTPMWWFIVKERKFALQSIKAHATPPSTSRVFSTGRNPTSQSASRFVSEKNGLFLWFLKFALFTIMHLSLRHSDLQPQHVDGFLPGSGSAACRVRSFPADAPPERQGWRRPPWNCHCRCTSQHGSHISLKLTTKLSSHWCFICQGYNKKQVGQHGFLSIRIRIITVKYKEVKVKNSFRSIIRDDRKIPFNFWPNENYVSKILYTEKYMKMTGKN